MPRRRVLITGVCGFSGRYLAARLRRGPDVTILGLDREPAPPGLVDGHFRCGLTDPAAVRAAIIEARPDVVYHLAGLIGPAPAEQIEEVNVGGYRALVEALRLCAREAAEPIRVLTVGSAAEIGPVDRTQLPLTELVPCRPETAYGKSKLAVTHLACSEPAEGPLAIVVARAFNLVGPGLSPQLALGSFARQLADVRAGRADAIRCGPLDGRRDYVDVRDTVEAYMALAERGRAGQIYNVCAGRSQRMADLLQIMIELAGRRVPVIIDAGRTTAVGPDDIYGDRTKIAHDVGWEPAIPIRQSLAELVQWACGRG
jgi:GDP-4-dehydro-6-deoxy-D-mannose reductase